MTAGTREQMLAVALTTRAGTPLLPDARRMVRFTRAADGTLEAVEPIRFSVLVRPPLRTQVGGVMVMEGDDERNWRWTPLPPETFQRNGWYTLKRFAVPPNDAQPTGGRHRTRPVDTSARDREIAAGMAKFFFPRRRKRRESLRGHVAALIAAIRDEERLSR